MTISLSGRNSRHSKTCVQDFTEADIFFKCEERILNRSMTQEGRAFLKVHEADKEVSKTTQIVPQGDFQ